MLWTSLALLCGLVYVLHKYFSRDYGYWKDRNVFFFKPVPFLGNFKEILFFREAIGEYLGKLYRQTKEPYFGIFVFDKPLLIVRSPDLIKFILVKDFKHFDNRAVASAKHDPLVGHMLFFDKNPEWRIMRNKMSPILTTGNLKAMVSLVTESGAAMANFIGRTKPNVTLDAKEICSKFTTNVIARCAFGIDAHSFDNEDAEFRRVGRTVFDFSLRNAISQAAYFFLPGLVELFHLKFVDPKASAFFRKTFWAVLHEREKSGVKEFDVLEAIIAMKNSEEFHKDVANFEGDKLLAQALQFFLAGFETTSTAMAFTMYEMCLNAKLQDRLREDISSNMRKYGGMTYEAMQNMKFVHSCILESVRKYPVLPFLDRRCMEDYKVPDTDFVIEKGTPIYIPVFGLHYDPQYFPDPSKYDPDRFSEENIDKIQPFTYLAFGQGPRGCVGQRFAYLSAKVGLSYIFSEFAFERAETTPEQIEFEPKSFLIASKVGLPMKMRRIANAAA